MATPDRAIEPLFNSEDARIRVAVDEARMEMVTELHRAVYGDTWARPQPPSVVWAELIEAVSMASRQFRRRSRPTDIFAAAVEDYNDAE